MLQNPTPVNHEEYILQRNRTNESIRKEKEKQKRNLSKV